VHRDHGVGQVWGEHADGVGLLAAEVGGRWVGFVADARDDLVDVGGGRPVMSAVFLVQLCETGDLLILAACATSLIVERLVAGYGDGLFAVWSDEQAVGVDWPAGVGPAAAERQCGRRRLPIGDRETAMPSPRFGW